MNPYSKSEQHFFCRRLKPLLDLGATVGIWTYFTLGFVVLFSPLYLAAWITAENRELAFQRLNHKFYRGFFFVARIFIPGHRWQIPDDIRLIRSAVIVCNHLSYLDPLVLISVFERHKTIVKSSFFKVPIFGRMLLLSGYIPSASEGRLSAVMIENMETMQAYLASGGNLFIFPEGTRSRNGSIGSLNKGAFKIARLCRAPVVVLRIYNTDKLFEPGKYLFNACATEAIRVEQLARIHPDYQSDTFAISELMGRVRSLLETPGEKINGVKKS